MEGLAETYNLTKYEFKSRLATPTRTFEQKYSSMLVDPYEYHQEKLEGRPIFRYIQTHPDMDHLSGLYNFFWAKKVPLENFWDTNNNKSIPDSEFTGSRYSLEDWLAYRLLRQGYNYDANVESEEKTVVAISPTRNDSASFWKEDGITILSPTDELVDSCNANGVEYNNCSYVLRIDYAGRRVILPGDAVEDAWTDIYINYSASELKCDVLKAAHHGRRSGFHELAVADMSPSAVVCSVGKSQAPMPPICTESTPITSSQHGSLEA
ncbi:hypothetical protein [Amycolatopsis thailandensis]|uniref:hypothetical protein n=1 Tax=Amycolatopsis thailandensis TaxID=589330 RepID=UPI001178BBE2|nr:hypothetical protein [Amycolatopsis thailandensis]